MISSRWMSILFAMVALVLPAGFTGTASAADFTFNVPVELTYLPAYSNAGRINCVVCPGDITPGYLTCKSGVGANGVTDFTISGGNYVGIVTVYVDFANKADAAKGRKYMCHLRLRDHGGYMSFVGDGIDNTKPVVQQVNGDIPPQ